MVSLVIMVYNTQISFQIGNISAALLKLFSFCRSFVLSLFWYYPLSYATDEGQSSSSPFHSPTDRVRSAYTSYSSCVGYRYNRGLDRNICPGDYLNSAHLSIAVLGGNFRGRNFRGDFQGG